MSESFELPVQYKGKELLLPAQLHQFGYGYKIEVEVNGSSVFFERDDERNWRALIETDVHLNERIESKLLEAIAASLEGLFE